MSRSHSDEVAEWRSQSQNGIPNITLTAHCTSRKIQYSSIMDIQFSVEQNEVLAIESSSKDNDQVVSGSGKQMCFLSFALLDKCVSSPSEMSKLPASQLLHPFGKKSESLWMTQEAFKRLWEVTSAHPASRGILASSRTRWEEPSAKALLDHLRTLNLDRSDRDSAVRPFFMLYTSLQLSNAVTSWVHRRNC